MGMVLSFVPRTAATKRPILNTDTAPAVIIFPGVRYERPRAESAPGVALPDNTRPSQTTPAPRH